MGTTRASGGWWPARCSGVNPKNQSFRMCEKHLSCPSRHSVESHPSTAVNSNCRSNDGTFLRNDSLTM